MARVLLIDDDVLVVIDRVWTQIALRTNAAQGRD
jgi:hypothetical protein